MTRAIAISSADGSPSCIARVSMCSISRATVLTSAAALGSANMNARVIASVSNAVWTWRASRPPPPGERQDWALDADDVASQLQAPVHLAAHSYGVVGALIAAAQAPQHVRSLTLIEPPLFYLVPGDGEVARLERMGNAVLLEGLSADAATLREFLRLAGSPGVNEGPLPEEVARGVRRAHGSRPPGDARPDLTPLRKAAVPTLVASGGHSAAIERICDALAQHLRAQRALARGAGHFVAAAPAFAARFERFLRSVP